MRRVGLVISGSLAGLLGFASPARAQRDSIDAWAEALLQQRRIPGLALAIVHRGEVVKVKGYGLANVEHNVPTTPATVFQSASLGKQFTAAVVLLLAHDGKLALDDPIARYLSGTPAAWQSITIRHLLTHTSGIPDYESDSTWMDFRRDYTDVELLRIFARHPPLFAPGDDWSYSNTGYVLLGMIIGAVTGAHWSEFARARIFRPLGMETARVISEDEIILNRAAGYEVVGGALKNQEWVSPSLNRTADGSLYLTVLDLAKWDAALYGTELLSDSLKQLMWAPVRLNDGTTASHGFGWFLLDQPGRRAVESDGAWQGFRSYFGRFVSDSLTVIVLANSTTLDPVRAGHALAALYRPSLGPPAPARISLSPRALAEYVGEYRLPTGEVLRVSIADSGLRVDGDVPLGHVRPEARDVFTGVGWGESRLVFARDGSGAVRWLHPRRHPSWPVRATKVR